jgi:hypothetical protein
MQDEAAHEAGGVMSLGALDMGADEVAGTLRLKADLGAGPPGCPGRRLPRPAEVVEQPLRPLLGLGAAQPEATRPATESRGGEQLEALFRVQGAQGAVQQPADQLLADQRQRPGPALFAAAQERIDHLK